MKTVTSTNTRLCVAALLAPVALTGCGGSSSSGTSAPTLTPRSVSTTLSDGLMGTLTEDRSIVSKGGTVNYTLTLSNPTTQPITYQPADGPDFTVRDPAGNVAYPFEIPALIGIGASVTLAPGQSVVSETDVVNGINGSGYSLPGQYKATGFFAVYQGGTNTSNEIVATAGPLSVTVQ